MAVYADTSFLGSYYLPDANSALALAAIRALSVPIVFTALHRLELRNTLALAFIRVIARQAEVNYDGDMKVDHTVQVWKEGGQFIAHAMLLNVASSGFDAGSGPPGRG